MWNLTSYQKILSFSGHSSYILGLSELKNGYLATGSRDKTIKTWDVQTGQLKSEISIHSYPIYALETTENGYLISGEYDESNTAANLFIKICYP